MGEIKLGDNTIVTSMGNIADSVDAAVAGFEKAKAVIGGIYDDLVLWERENEKWQDKAFDVRANEIEHLHNLGMISAQEEGELWKELFNVQEYGWRNVKTAEENYHKSMYEHSKHWIEEQTELGILSASEIAEAWQRVYQSFDDVNIKYQAAINIRNALLGQSDGQTSERRSDSDRYMRRQDIYDGGDSSRQIDDYSRRIISEKELLKEIGSGFLNGVELGPIEQTQRWKEVYEFIQDLEDERYTVSKEYLQKQTDDYISQSKNAIDEKYEYQLKMYNNKLSELKQDYNDSKSDSRMRELNVELNELLSLRSYYKNAVTKEGQDKYKDAASRISEIYSKQQDEEDKQKYKEDEALLQGKISKLKEAYQNSLDSLEQSKTSLLQMSGQAALEGIATATSAGSFISNVLLGINQAFAGQVESLFSKTEYYLNNQVSKISQAFDSLGNFSNSFNVGSNSQSADTNVSVTLNDYGDKNLADSNAVVSYVSEFISVLQNALRSKGVK